MKLVKTVIAALLLLLPSIMTAQKGIDVEAHLSMSEKELFKHARDFRDNNQPDSALLYYTLLIQKSLGHHKENEEDYVLREAQAYIDMGNIYANTYHDYSKAYSCFRNAEEIAQKYRLNAELAECYTDLGVIYQIQAVTENTEIFTDTIYSLYKKGFRYAMESKNPQTILSATRNMLLSALETRRERGIMPEIDAYLAWDRNSENEDAVFVKGLCLLAKGMANSDSGMTRKGLVDIVAARDKEVYYSMVYHDLMADLELRHDNPRNALAHLDSLSALTAADDKWVTMQVAKKASECHRRLGDTISADSNLLDYFKDRDTLLNQGNIRYVKDMHFMNELEGISAEMNRINLEREYQKRWLVSVSVVAILLLVLLVMLIVTHRRLRRSHAVLFEQSRRIVMEGQEEEPSPAPSDKDAPKYQGTNLSEEEKDDILVKIKDCLKKEDMICDTSFQLKTMAEAIGEKARTVSQIINEKCGCNFTTLLAEARIKCVCRRILQSADYRRLTIEAIAESAGIKSRSYFASTFKRFTGLNPSEYIRRASHSPISPEA